MLKLEHVKKTYEGVTILKDINLEIEDGEIVSILGPSGCGKTTLLNLILGLTLSDHVMIINDGSISQYGKPEEIVKTPENDFVKEFILRQLEIKKNNIYSLFMVAEALGEAETAGWIGLAPLTLYVQTDKILISMFLGVSYFCISKRKGEIK